MPYILSFYINVLPFLTISFPVNFTAFMEPDHLAKRYRAKRSQNNVTEMGHEHSRSKRAIPHIIYPEILVIVDYDGYRLHGGDNVQVICI